MSGRCEGAVRSHDKEKDIFLSCTDTVPETTSRRSPFPARTLMKACIPSPTVFPLQDRGLVGRGRSAA